jgi:hypothetical protein
MGNDCSERVCQFGLAHVDTPKGDLDNSGTVGDARYPVIENNFVYPYGTTEMYPETVDSNLETVTNSAHYYMECSNKGNCDRKKGTCACYPGYDGASCQRASCPGYPNSCSGHGVCKSIQQLANADAGNIYELWDRHKTMGCECDAGFHGADCSARKCKTGVDPLYMDDSATIKYPIWNVATLSHHSGATDASELFYNGMVEAGGPGYWALRVYDAHGEDWLTEPIPGGATCAQVKQALYNIPNDVVPDDSVSCTLVETDGPKITTEPKNEENDLGSIDYLGTDHERAIVYKFAFWDSIDPDNHLRMQAGNNANDGSGGLPASFDQTNQQTVIGFVYRLKMFGNPGALKEPEIEIYLDGDRPTLAAQDHAPAQSGYESTLITKVWTDGMQGEDNDYFADHCDGVTVNVRSADHTAAGENLPKRIIHYLGLTAAESQLLKACLGSANFQEHDNIDSYDWDYGSREFPHIIKLVRSVTSVTDGGHYVALIFKPYAGENAAEALTGNGESSGYYELVNPWVPLDATDSDTEDDNDYEVYTTKGVLALTSDKADAFFGFAEKEVYTMNVEDELSRQTNAAAAHHFGSLSCEWVGNGKFRSQERVATWDHTNFEQDSFEEVDAHHADGVDPVWGRFAETKICLNKTDIVIPLAIPEDFGVSNTYNKKTAIDIPDDGTTALSDQTETDVILNRNPPRINMYTVESIYTREIVATELQVHAGDHVYDGADELDKQLSHMWRNVIKLDKSTNWGTGANIVAASTSGDLLQGFRMYKFHPAAASTYNYVAPCSNRGLCDSKSGICECFPGYGNDNCDEQNALAL